jgi:hypothetical protein
MATNLLLVLPLVGTTRAEWCNKLFPTRVTRFIISNSRKRIGSSSLSSQATDGNKFTSCLALVGTPSRVMQQASVFPARVTQRFISNSRERGGFSLLSCSTTCNRKQQFYVPSMEVEILVGQRPCRLDSGMVHSRWLSNGRVVEFASSR